MHPEFLPCGTLIALSSGPLLPRPSPRPPAPGSPNRRHSLCLQGFPVFSLPILFPFFSGRTARCRAKRPMAQGNAWGGGRREISGTKKGPKVWFSHTLGPFFDILAPKWCFFVGQRAYFKWHINNKLHSHLLSYLSSKVLALLLQTFAGLETNELLYLDGCAVSLGYSCNILGNALLAVFCLYINLV